MSPISPEERLDVIRSNYRNAKKRIVGTRSDSFYKRYYAEGLAEIWGAFDSFLGLKFPARSNNRMRQLLCEKYQSIYSTWGWSDNCRESLKRLQQLAPVPDMSPVKPQEDAILNDTNNLLEILNFSYRVRSNLYHGGFILDGESLTASKNRELVEHSLRVTFEIFGRILRNENISVE